MSQKSKRLTINLISQIIAFMVGIGVSFFLTPYITEKLGKEVYGFVGMAYQVTSYISMFTVAFNAMLNVFVATEYHKDNKKKANEYYTSVLVADTVLSVILIVPLLLIVIFMDKFMDVPVASLNDIKLLWGIIFLTFLFQLATGPLGVGFFVSNRLDVSAKRSITTNVIKGGVLLGTFCLLVPRVWYVGLASMISILYSIAMNYKYKNIFTPEIRYKKEAFNFKSIKELLAVGIWNTVNQLTNILLNGLDLLISNVFISALAMSFISYAQTFPLQISNLLVTVSNTFTPSLTKNYAKNDKDEFKKNVYSAMKICGCICSIPLVGFIVFGLDFYKLWLHSLSADEALVINRLSWLILVPTYISIYTFPLNSVQTITKKIKVPVLFSLTISIVNIIAELILLKFTSLGVYSIEIATAVVLGVRNFIFIPLYSAHNLKCKWYTFYPTIIRGLFSSTVVLVLFYFVHQFVSINSWLDLIIIAVIAGLIGYVINMIILLNKEERKMFIRKFFKLKKNSK